MSDYVAKGRLVIWTVAFWKGAFERAVKTFGQAAGAFIAADAVGILSVDWQELLSVAGLAAIASVFTSLGNADFVAGPVAKD